MPIKFNRFDIKLLGLLQRDASLSINELAAKTGLSTSPCWRRISRFDEEGIVQKRVAILDHEKIGLAVTVFAEVRLMAHGHQALPNFQRTMEKFPEVLECYTILGEIDFLLKVVTVDIHAYEKFLHELLSLPMVREVNSRMAVSEIKCTTELPLRHIQIE